jgi:dTDP-4-dehydrorhamnose 3,5-epimerase
MVEIDKAKLSPRTGNMQNIAKLQGCRLIENANHVDIRGLFRKILPVVDGTELITFSSCQVNISTNTLAGTIRGLHYQVEPFLESKLISCIKGSVVDVLLDMRPTSETYGKFAFYSLTPNSGSLLVPPLVAHGFQTQEDETILLYLHSNSYSPENSQGVNPLDPSIGISWPLPLSSISDSDRNLPLLSEVKN